MTLMPVDTTADTALLLLLVLPTDPADALAKVRDWVRKLLPDVTDPTRIDAVLIVDELVSNAYSHGGAPRMLRLHRTGDGNCLRVEVNDSAATAPRLGKPQHGNASGGLMIIDQLCSNWGVAQHANHKTVWAEYVLE